MTSLTSLTIQRDQSMKDVPKASNNAATEIEMTSKETSKKEGSMIREEEEHTRSNAKMRVKRSTSQGKVVLCLGQSVPKEKILELSPSESKPYMHH